MLDHKSVWLVGALGAMLAACMATLSRSGVIAGVPGVLWFLWLSGDRLGRRGRVRLGVCYRRGGRRDDVREPRRHDVARERHDGERLVGRREIWASTWTMIRDFWRTGVGIGGYARAMSAYQPPHVFAFNHAHDEYLQVLAEGGILLAAATAAAVLAGAQRAAARLREDRTAMFWMRAGALSGVIAIATQSVWDTSLRMPANALLCALCCAIALHRPASA